ncbi:sialidase family protein [Streptomyces davaonensis]|uniref:sialidase family protein n=1 Tax=Streptomyces davaonensis TaxID=348043 RepID=UPI0005A17F1B|nr:sialidase family protein [Streptomyces davaonensis]
MSRPLLSRRAAVLVGVVICIAALVVFVRPWAEQADSADDESGRGCVSSVPYVAGVGGYGSYRIPAVVRTRGGDLLAFAEGRVGGKEDHGDIDVVVRRSGDGGCTWGQLRVVAEGDGNTRGNPAPVVDPRTGNVVLVTSCHRGGVTEAQILRGEAVGEAGRRVFVQVSEDEGRSFSVPREITSTVKKADWRWYATGPGHAVALTRGDHAGRLVVPANHSSAPASESPDSGQEPKYYGAHAIYSDDGGRSWHLGFVEDSYEGVRNANESTAAQLPDGRLYFNARNQKGSSPGNRLDAYSSDGGASLEGRGYVEQASLNDVPLVEGSVLQVGGEGGELLFSGPSVPDDRAAMALWSSADEGRTFRKALTLSTRKAGYSDLVQIDGEGVGVLYETGTRTAYETIEFRRVPLGSL